MASRFLFNEELWDELTASVPKQKGVCAAVAYLGTGASRFLPLKKGDRLVADMSLKTVRAGGTNPQEVERFLKRGVQVFTRGSLHAKFFLVGREVIAGSANVSAHARECLDEAAILTDDPAAVRRAASTFEKLCTEPVRAEYLKRCMAEYREPKFVAGVRRQPEQRSTSAKLWLISGGSCGDLLGSPPLALR